MALSSTSFQTGLSGNPKGRPLKGYSITETFREMFNSNPTIKRKLANGILDKAIKGDIGACKLIWNYMDGLPQTDKKSLQSQQSQILQMQKLLMESEKERYGL